MRVTMWLLVFGVKCLPVYTIYGVPVTGLTQRSTWNLILMPLIPVVTESPNLM